MKLAKENKWVSIRQSMDSFSIEIFRLKLEDEGIPVMVWDERDSSYNAFGYIHLQVLQEDQAKANEIIDSLA